MIRSFDALGDTDFSINKKPKLEHKIPGPINDLHNELIGVIFSNLSSKSIVESSLFVNKNWCEIGKESLKRKYQEAIFDLKKWACLLSRGIVPTEGEIEAAWSLLPLNIDEILKRPCKIYPDKLVLDSHLLIYIEPEIFNHKISLPLLEESMKNLPDSINKPLGYKSNHRGGWEQLFGNLDLKLDKPQWFLILRDIVPDSFGMDCKQQKEMLDGLSRISALSYKFPKTVIAVVSTIAQLMQSGNLPFSSGLTRCEEDLVAHQNNVVGILPQYANSIYLSTNSQDAIKYIGVTPMMEMS